VNFYELEENMTANSNNFVQDAEAILSGRKTAPDPKGIEHIVAGLKEGQAYIVAVRLLLQTRKNYPKEGSISRSLEDLSCTAAGEIIAGSIPLPSPSDLKELVKALKAVLHFGRARRLLRIAQDKYPGNTWIVQQLALCTYKDEELQPDTRFRQALQLLESLGLRREVVEDPPETLSLGGAVYKRKWEYGGRLEDLYEALVFYRAGWEASLQSDPPSTQPRIPPRDYGYGAVNAAYMLDVLSWRARILSERTGTSEDLAKQYAGEAANLRRQALELLLAAFEKDKELSELDWFAATIAELYFGLKDYSEAGQWLYKAEKCCPSEWEIQTTFKQLVNIARMQGVPPPKEKQKLEDWEPAWQALAQFLGEEQAVQALSCYRGKVGLALSGGGFRASLFHLGVLARLAEMDVLRSVEVLSTVSGGSIVGAHYYLEVQQTLENMKDSEITRQTYIDIVRRVQKRFLKGIQRNLRTRTLTNLGRNLKMIFSGEYSRSHRIGEQYEAELYSRIGEKETRHIAPRAMPELLIKPKDFTAKDEFKPKFHNWRRRAKVPVLLLNTTSLNSGHSWHFTGRWMGEPPGSIGTEVDVNERYRRLWYQDAPKDSHKRYRLGYAVAASACVPGLFEPLAIEGLYPGRTVRLVDGGVHDNQGVQGLLDEGCTLVLCSDASGQMEDFKQPSNSIIGVPLRSNSILMDRVREAEYCDLRVRLESRAIQGLFFVHLKKDLDTRPVDWIGCKDLTPSSNNSANTTVYNVDKDLQHKIAALRTDLDTFSEVEACSLMLSGYLMTEYEFRHLNELHQHDREPGTWGDFDIDADRQKGPGEWEFLKLKNLLQKPPDRNDARRTDLGRQLDVGSAAAFKIWKLNFVLRVISWGVAAAALFLLIWCAYTFWDDTIPTPQVSVGAIVVSIAIMIAGIVIPIIKWLSPQKAMRGYLNKALVALGGFVLANVHVFIFDPLFRKRGSLDRLLKLR
jgi:predicted acylesterase/phospholipase RssA